MKKTLAAILAAGILLSPYSGECSVRDMQLNALSQMRQNALGGQDTASFENYKRSIEQDSLKGKAESEQRKAGMEKKYDNLKGSFSQSGTSSKGLDVNGTLQNHSLPDSDVDSAGNPVGNIKRDGSHSGYVEGAGASSSKREGFPDIPEENLLGDKGAQSEGENIGSSLGFSDRAYKFIGTSIVIFLAMLGLFFFGKKHEM